MCNSDKKCTKSKSRSFKGLLKDLSKNKPEYQQLTALSFCSYLDVQSQDKRNEIIDIYARIYRDNCEEIEQLLAEYEQKEKSIHE